MKLNIKCDALGYQKDLCNDSFEEKISSYDCFSLALLYKLTNEIKNLGLQTQYASVSTFGNRDVDVTVQMVAFARVDCSEYVDATVQRHA